MTISALSGLGSAQQQQGIKNADAKLQAVIASIVSGTTSDSVANVALATQLQSQTSGLKQISGNLAQGLSLAQVADGGAEQIQNALVQLQSLALQAKSPTLNSENRAQLNQQFQQIINQVDQLAASTTFNGKSLLDGSLSGDHALSLDTILNAETSGSSSALSIDNLSSGGLFGGANLDILSADNAGQAFTAIGKALNQVVSNRSNIGAFQQTINFASANIDSAIINQEAAQATLSETDLAAASTQNALANVQRNASIALEAQGNLLSPQLLKLIG